MKTETEVMVDTVKDEKKSLFQVAEVRMVLYVVPLVIIFFVVSYLLNAAK